MMSSTYCIGDFLAQQWKWLRPCITRFGNWQAGAVNYWFHRHLGVRAEFSDFVKVEG
jgi:hypothetical protein